jgi:4-amino-4-deoxy-L-arabinose transferase-like glycosyltransferase
MSDPEPDSARERRRLPWFVPALATLWLALRFVGLEQSPPGFYGDEFRGALHQICLGETGESAYGERWPLFVRGAGGGYYTPPFLYFGAGWAQVFGYSIASFRAIAAFFGVLTIVALYGWVRRAAGREIAAWSALVAALSPWSFQFSRIAWDPPLAPAFLMLGLWAWSQARAVPAGLLSGALAALAMYAYPPMRIQAPLVFGVLFAVELAGRRLRARAFVAFALSAALVALPLLLYTLSGEINQRGLAEAVFSPEYVAKHRGADPPIVFILKTTLANFLAHFGPGYLFFTGDANARHSTQRIGELGFVEVLAVGIGVLLLLERWLGGGARTREEGASGSWGARPLVLFSGFAVLAGILPAALCYTGVPHALRSIGAWPFQAVVFGFLLSRFARKGARAVGLIAAVAVLHTAYFAHAYFVAYPKVHAPLFHVSLKQILTASELDTREAQRAARIAPAAYRYYRILADGLDCETSAVSVSRFLEGAAHDEAGVGQPP